MKYAIVKISKIDNEFDYNQSILCKYFNNDNDVIKYVDEILPEYDDIIEDMHYLNLFRQLCPSSDYFIINIDEVKVFSFQYLIYNDYLKILKSIRLNKLKQIE